MVDPTKIRFTGPLVVHRQGLWAWLLGLGYSPLSAMNLLRVTAHLGRWLDDQSIPLAALTHEHIEVFLQVRRSRYTQFFTRRALAPILDYLEQVGAIALPPAVVSPPSAVDRVVEPYTRYLLLERGVTLETARAYGDVTRRLFKTRHAVLSDEALRLQASDVTSFVLESASHYSTGTTKYIVTALRSFLRYLYLEGKLKFDLTGTLPAVAGWRLRGLPKALDAEQVRRLLDSCDRRRHVGRRDYAVLVLLVRLGLRRIEVARLMLHDIDWRAGELLVRGKGHRNERLPLPNDVGEALASYLRKGRPTCPSLRDKRVSPHVLRHTTAVNLLQAGVDRSVIALWLGHEQLETTQIYLAADLKMKERALARTAPLPAHIARYRPDDALLDFLEGL